MNLRYIPDVLEAVAAVRYRTPPARAFGFEDGYGPAHARTDTAIIRQCHVFDMDDATGRRADDELAWLRGMTERFILPAAARGEDR